MNGDGFVNVYRCARCGHGKHLTAWGSATVHGPLAPDGTIEAFDWDEVWQVQEDSIQCEEHPGGGLEKLIGGQWCGLRACPLCSGATRVVPKPRCTEEGFTEAGAGPRDKPVHAGWWPLAVPVPPPSCTLLGHVPLALESGSPGCRGCRHYLSSDTGRQPCEGDRHRCPAPAGEDDGTPAWKQGQMVRVCGQPGEMSGDFTRWRCNRGHVTTREGHVPRYQRHEDTCPGLDCPWEYLGCPDMPGTAATASGTVS